MSTAKVCGDGLERSAWLGVAPRSRWAYLAKRLFRLEASWRASVDLPQPGMPEMPTMVRFEGGLDSCWFHIACAREMLLSSVDVVAEGMFTDSTVSLEMI